MRIRRKTRMVVQHDDTKLVDERLFLCTSREIQSTSRSEDDGCGGSGIMLLLIAIA
jgi:hypothetical protein